MKLSSGQKLKLQELTSSNLITVEISSEINTELDIACFGLDENRKLSDDRYMVFYNQRTSPESAISMSNTADKNKEKFSIDFEKLPAKIKYIVFTATIDGQETMNALTNFELTIKDNQNELCTFNLTGNDFNKEKAITVLEIYYKDLWRINAIGKGFNGGLGALIVDFGGELADGTNAEETNVNANQPINQPINSKKIDLEKRIEKEAPELVQLTKKAKISLEKSGLGEHRAKVALCLDISASMRGFYANGDVQAFAERILALATRLDDDGNIDIFLFGTKAYEAGECNISNYKSYVPNLMRDYKLEGSTNYNKAINMIRKFYLKNINKGKEVIRKDIPIYVMFLTDGDTFNKAESENEIRQASYEPIFWSFMGIGKDKFLFLEKLDELSGRYLDNASLLIAKTLRQMSDEQLYDALMKEYVTWVGEAKSKGLIN